MLFDLRGAGRQRVVKVVYITLAFLIGGGLVFFGIGSSGIGGGLFDAFSNAKQSSDANTDRLRKQEVTWIKRVAVNSKDANAYAQLALTRTKLANQGEYFDPAKGDYTVKGKAKLREAGAAWDKYLALEPAHPDTRVARSMVQAFGAIGESDKLVIAQELVAKEADTAATYAQLAAYAYGAGQTRKGDLATTKALALTDPDMREALKGQLESAKQQGAAAAALPSPTP